MLTALSGCLAPVWRLWEQSLIAGTGWKPAAHGLSGAGTMRPRNATAPRGLKTVTAETEEKGRREPAPPAYR